jgi:hypothetical protein
MPPMRGFILRFTSTSILVLLIVLTSTGLHALVWYGPGAIKWIRRSLFVCDTHSF